MRPAILAVLLAACGPRTAAPAESPPPERRAPVVAIDAGVTAVDAAPALPVADGWVLARAELSTMMAFVCLIAQRDGFTMHPLEACAPPPAGALALAGQDGQTWSASPVAEPFACRANGWTDEQELPAYTIDAAPPLAFYPASLAARFPSKLPGKPWKPSKAERKAMIAVAAVERIPSDSKPTVTGVLAANLDSDAAIERLGVVRWGLPGGDDDHAGDDAQLPVLLIDESDGAFEVLVKEGHGVDAMIDVRAVTDLDGDGASELWLEGDYEARVWTVSEQGGDDFVERDCTASEMFEP